MTGNLYGIQYTTTLNLRLTGYTFNLESNTVKEKQLKVMVYIIVNTLRLNFNRTVGFKENDKTFKFVRHVSTEISVIFS